MAGISLCKLKARGQTDNVILELVIMEKSKLIFKITKWLFKPACAYICPALSILHGYENAVKPVTWKSTLTS